MSRPVMHFAPIFIALCVTLSCKYRSRPEAPFKALGVWYRVKAGDTLASIATRYKTETRLVAELNDLSGDAALQRREEIFVPTRSGKPPGAGARPTPVPATGNADRLLVNGPVSKEQPCGIDGHPCLLWPVDGDLLLRFETRAGAPHDGIDISAPKGTPIVAAADGEVIYSGDAIKGYGNLIIIRHEKELITVYAHNEENMVKEGDRVSRGMPIAKVGETGSASKPHLHFEVRVGETPRDPLGYLPHKKRPRI